MHKTKRGANPAAMFEVPTEPKTPAPREPSEAQAERQFVDQAMYLLTAPYLAFPPWEDVWNNENHRFRAVTERMKHHQEIFLQGMCTEFEAMIYISSATLAFPPSHDWFEIYMYLF